MKKETNNFLQGTDEKIDYTEGRTANSGEEEIWPHNIKCRKCGAKWGIDDRAFEVGKKPEESYCFVCKMNETKPEFLKVLKKMRSFKGSIYEEKLKNEKD